MIRLHSLEAFAFRVPIEKPLEVAFGTFRDRPLVLVRAIDEDGVEGWGEIWCNWPAVGAEHRARLAVDLGESLPGRTFEAPRDLAEDLRRRTEVLVLQTGEVGPVAQVIAGIDIAVWDLLARKRGVPLYRALRDGFVETVPVYVTGLNPDHPERFAAPRREDGHRAFKLKIGFGRELDLRNIVALRETLGDDATLMVDANQAFTLEAARDMAAAAADFDLQWLEEPLRVDRPAAEWRALAEASPIPLAGGENLRDDAFDDAIRDGLLRVMQPDVTKWGGVSGNIAVAHKAVAAGMRYCPHVFGGGVALLASLHLLAAAGGDGLLELDCHPNAARERIVEGLLPVRDGHVPVPQDAGLGTAPDLAVLDRYRTWPGR